LILRIDNYLNYQHKIGKKTDTSTYHGSWIADEIAALFSLNLGIRLKAGGITRVFAPDKDPKGEPRMHDMHLDPVLTKNLERRQIILYADHSICIQDAKLVERYPDLSSTQAITLIKSARLYQDALWISESQPAFSWLFFVSAIEIAANHWQKNNAPSLERLKAEKPELIELLEPFDPELPQKVANLIIDSIGSTKKFTDFIIHFLPDPPSQRPQNRDQIFWDEDNMTKYLKVIYRLRSEALHQGTPFPAPLCMAPYGPSNEVYIEKPTDTAMSTLGSTWTAKDLPMYLHIFEYIVRGSLLKWWRSNLK